MGRMRAAWWWIDRWRKSSAYTGMTLEEQGAYRNLLDELWLRDGVLPTDDRQLANICGDARRWNRVKTNVLARFTLTPAGWRHETHDEVSASVSKFQKAQQLKGKKGAEARWKKDDRTDGPADGPANGRSMAEHMASVHRTPYTDSSVPSEQATVASAPSLSLPTGDLFASATTGTANTGLAPVTVSHSGTGRKAKRNPPKELKPPRPDAAPTRELIECWQEHDRAEGIEPHGAYGHHAKVFRTLYEASGRDLTLSRLAIQNYRQDRSAFVVSQGHGIGEFGRTLERWVRAARGTAPAPQRSVSSFPTQIERGKEAQARVLAKLGLGPDGKPLPGTRNPGTNGVDPQVLRLSSQGER